MTFARFVILPAIKLHERLSRLPESLIVVLSTLHLVREADTRLVEVTRESAHVKFAVGNGVRVAGYRLKNFLNLEQMSLEALCGRRRRCYQLSFS